MELVRCDDLESLTRLHAVWYRPELYSYPAVRWTTPVWASPSVIFRSWGLLVSYDYYVFDWSVRRAGVHEEYHARASETSYSKLHGRMFTREAERRAKAQ